MPYQLMHVEAAKNPRLKSFPEIPEGYEEPKIHLGGYKKVTKIMTIDWLKVTQDGPFSYHFCKGWNRFDKTTPGCGWVEGDPNEYQVNTLAPLAGRQGTDYHCAKCGCKIGFRGVVS